MHKSTTLRLLALAVVMVLLGLSIVNADVCCVGRTGNADCDPSDAVDGGDLSALLDVLFISLDEPCCFEEANMDGEGGVDGVDLSLMLDHLFINLAPLPWCPESSPAGYYLERTNCKMFDETKDETPENLDCLQYEYDGVGTLRLTHVNAGFNCCPTLAPVVTVNHHTIHIDEVEVLGECLCLCLFDLDYEVLYLPPGEYTIVVNEPYLPTGDVPLQTTLDLTAAVSGEYCETRSEYPWGPLSIGSTVGMSECKSSNDKSTTPPDMDCVEWDYNEGSGELSLVHVNAVFNCCPTIDVNITVEDDLILVEEIEVSGDCDCNCLYDVDYLITGLEAGTYTLRFVEPYMQPGDDPLEVTVSLVSTPAGSHCVSRDYYPWGEY